MEHTICHATKLEARHTVSLEVPAAALPPRRLASLVSALRAHGSPVEELAAVMAALQDQAQELRPGE